MSNIYVATEMDLVTHKHVTIHKFNLPSVSEPKFYRSVMAYNAFFCSPKRRNTTKTHHYIGYHQEEFAFELKSIVRSHLKDLPVVTHDTIFDFFKYIEVKHPFK